MAENLDPYKGLPTIDPRAKPHEQTSEPQVPRVDNNKEMAITSAGAIGVAHRDCKNDPFMKPSLHDPWARAPAGQPQFESGYQAYSHCWPKFLRKALRLQGNIEAITGQLQPDKRLIKLAYVGLSGTPRDVRGMDSPISTGRSSAGTHRITNGMNDKLGGRKIRPGEVDVEIILSTRSHNDSIRGSSRATTARSMHSYYGSQKVYSRPKKLGSEINWQSANQAIGNGWNVNIPNAARGRETWMAGRNYGLFSSHDNVLTRKTGDTC